MVALACEPEEERYYTVEEYLEFEANSQIKHEYFDGRILPIYRDYDCRAMAAATSNHNRITRNILTSLNTQLGGRPAEPFAQDLRVRIGTAGHYTYPDVLVACPPLEWDREAPQDTLLNPKVIFEVLSRTTETFDRGEKFEHYRRLSSLTDYVLVSQERQGIEHYRRQESGEWLFNSIESGEEVLKVDSIGCSLTVAEIYERVEFPPRHPAVPAA